MAFSTINLKHPEFEVTKQVPVGFSWTVLFFGCFSELFRGDWKWAIVMLLLSLFTFGISHLVFIFLYNKLYLNSLLDKGFTSVDSEDVLKPVEAKLSRTIPRRK